LKEISAQITPAKESLYGKLNRIPTIKELSEYLGYSEEEILEAMESSQAYSTYSLNQTFDEGGEEGEGAILEKYTGREESGYNSFENAELIKTVMEDLSDREKAIFKRRYFKNETQQIIAADMGVSQMTISRLERKIRDKFKTAIKV
jgi:RNA polymerase sigma-B factor